MERLARVKFSSLWWWKGQEAQPGQWETKSDPHAKGTRGMAGGLVSRWPPTSFRSYIKELPCPLDSVWAKENRGQKESGPGIFIRLALSLGG